MCSVVFMWFNEAERGILALAHLSSIMEIFYLFICIYANKAACRQHEDP